MSEKHSVLLILILMQTYLPSWLDKRASSAMLATDGAADGAALWSDIMIMNTWKLTFV